MIHVSNLTEGLELFKALGSDVRVEILELLLKSDRMSMTQLANELDITNGALTSHIKKLEDCGLISITNESEGHGNQKLCSVVPDKILIDFNKLIDPTGAYTTAIKVGQFIDHRATPHCGLATVHSIIGEANDPRLFNHPDRFDADIIWLNNGYVEYAIPNLIPEGNTVRSIYVNFELGTQIPGANKSTTTVSLYINGQYAGSIPSDDNVNEGKGLFTPDWWPASTGQYGHLHEIVINNSGTYIDERKESDLVIRSLMLNAENPIRIRLAAEPSAEKNAGLTLFGKTYGNHSQDINVIVNYEKSY